VISFSVADTGDGGYDQDRVYDSVAERHPEAAVVVPPRATAVPSGTAAACCMDLESGRSSPNPVWGQAVRT